MKRPDMSPKEWRTLLQGGKFLQKQGENYFLFDCYSHNWEELTSEQAVDLLAMELRNLNSKHNSHQSERGRDA